MSPVMLIELCPRRFRGSTGAPISVVNARPLSVYRLPARSRSAVCAVLRFRSIATTAGDSGTVRCARGVLGSEKTSCVGGR